MEQKSKSINLGYWNQIEFANYKEEALDYKAGFIRLLCPSILNSRGSICGAHMFTLPIYVKFGQTKSSSGEIRFAIQCPVCLFRSTRRLATGK